MLRSGRGVLSTRLRTRAGLHHAVDERHRREPRALLILGQLVEPEALEHARRRCAFDGVDARGGPRPAMSLIRGRRRVGRVLQRPAERDQHLALRLASAASVRGRARPRPSSPTASARARGTCTRRVAEHEPVAVAQPAAAADALAVDERAVAREPVVDDDPVASRPARAGRAGARPRCPRSARRRVRRGARRSAARGRGSTIDLRAVAVAIEQERLAAALSVEASLDGERDVSPATILETTRAPSGAFERQPDEC